MSIYARLTIAFAVLAALLLVQVAVTMYASKQHGQQLADVVSAHEASNLLARMALEGQKMRRYEKEYFIYVADAERRAKYTTDWYASHNFVRDSLAAIDTAGGDTWSSSELERIATWRPALAAYERAFTRLDLQVNDGVVDDTFTANTAIQEGKNRFKVFLDGIAEEIRLKLDSTNAIATRAATQQRRLKILLYAVTAIGIALAAAMAIYVPAMIARPLVQLTRAANDMSKGKIRDDIPVTGPPEIRDLSESMERLRVALRGILQRLQATRSAATVTPIDASTRRG